jgi:hypothetical protein
MKPKLLLCFALVLSGGLFGCSSIDHPSANSKQPQVADFFPVETLTVRQLAEVKKNFHLMRPGMTEDEVFSMLGLAGYQHRLFPANFSRSNDWGISDYQLTDNERLYLFLDNTGMKTMKVQLPDGDKLEVWDYENSHVTNRLVIKAELDTMASFSNSPATWRPALQWPMVATNTPLDSERRSIFLQP